LLTYVLPAPGRPRIMTTMWSGRLNRSGGSNKSLTETISTRVSGGGARCGGGILGDSPRNPRISIPLYMPQYKPTRTNVLWIRNSSAYSEPMTSQVLRRLVGSQWMSQSQWAVDSHPSHCLMIWSVDVYLLEEQTGTISPRSDLKRGILEAFLNSVTPTTTRITSNMGSVPDPKCLQTEPTKTPYSVLMV